MATKKKQGSKKRSVSNIRPLTGQRPSTSNQAIDKVPEIKHTAKVGSRLSSRLKRGGKKPSSKLRPARLLLLSSLKLIWQNKKLFAGIVCIYAIIQLLFIQGLVSADFKDVTKLVKDAVEGSAASVVVSTGLFAYLVITNNQQVSAAGSVYQVITLTLSSLAIIWALRHAHKGASVRIRDAYYKGMYPLVPFILVFIVLLFQMIPFLFGAWLFTVIISNGIAVVFVEKIFWLVVGIAASLASFYMVTSSIIALYIVTLPDMTPMVALRSARDLVRHRRMQIFWRLCFMLLVSVFSLSALVILVIYIAPVFAPWVFYATSICMLVFLHAYVYGLYRELLNEQ